MEETIDIRTKTRKAVVSGVLWLVTVVLGVLAALAGRRLALDTHSRFFPGGTRTLGTSAYSLMNIIVSLTMAFLVIAIVIGGFEYHFRRSGTEESHRMFARTLAVEAGLLLLALFL